MNTLKHPDFEWMVQSTDHSSDELYPQRDHTLNSASGKYLLMTAHSPQHVGDRAIIVSDKYPIDNNREFCLKFFYYFKKDLNYGQFSKFEVYQSEDYLFSKINGKDNTPMVYKIGEVIGSMNTMTWWRFNVTARPLESGSTKMWFFLVSLLSK